MASFSFCLKISHKISCSTETLMANSFSFVMSENAFILPSVSKCISPGYFVLGWQVFPFSTLKKLCHCFLTCSVYYENSAVPLFSVLVDVIYPFFLPSFKILSLSLILRNLITVCLGIIFFMFLVFWIYWASKICEILVV